ncbi:hypothetical protein K8I85_15820 [bacterium]|nr:hypothetical protein [bacterium]
MGSASVFLRALYRRLKLIGTRRTSGMAASVGALSILVLAAPAMSQGIVDYDFWDLQPTVITNFADAAAKGVWGDMIDHVPDAERIPPPTVHASEYYPVHGALLREGTRGKLVFFANRTNDLMFLYDLNTAMPSATVYRTDPDTNLGPGEPYNVHRMFCAGHAFLPDGNLVIFGQHFGIDAPPSGNDGICDHSGFIGVANCDQGEDPSPGIICNCYTVPSPPAASIFDIEDASNGGLGKVYRIEDMPVLSHAYGGSDSSRYYPGGATLPSGNILVVGGNFWTDPSGDCCVLDEDPNYPFNRNWIELDSQTLSWSQVTNPMDPSWVNNDAYRMGMPHDYGKVIFPCRSGLARLAAGELGHREQQGEAVAVAVAGHAGQRCVHEQHQE